VSRPLYSAGYLKNRLVEIATNTALSVTDPLALWASKRVRLDGRPFSFEGHEYLRGIYDDTSPHVVVIKAAQIGGTTWAILRSIRACMTGLNVIYFFPTKTDVIEFSKSRVSPLIASNPFLTKLIRDTDTAGLKRIGDAYAYFRGMQSRVGLKSVPADMLVFDELDEATPDAKAMAKERLSHSDYRRVIELSNPSLPGYGIDEAYLESDQRHWTLKCPGCGHWVSLEREFPLKLGQGVRIIRPRGDGTYYRACPKCAHELDLAAGEWIADQPGQHTHGYRISQLFSSKVDPGDILREYQRTRYPERFYNLKIGLAWADVTHRVDRMTVLALCGDEPMLESSEAACTMGVDTGRQLHVVISRRTGLRSDVRALVYIGTHEDFGELDDLMKRFNVCACVIDAQPELHATREFARRHPGKVYMNYFIENQKGATDWDRQGMIVKENRTEALDLSRRVIREGKVVLPRQSAVVEEFASHMAAIAKKLEENEDSGEQKFTYVRSGPDHFSMAFTYDVLAWQRDRTTALIVGCRDDEDTSSIWLDGFEPGPSSSGECLRSLGYE